MADKSDGAGAGIGLIIAIIIGLVLIAGTASHG